MKTKALKAAFPYTIPIFAGFWFLALAYGILMNVNGFSFIYPMLMSLLIYGGSLEFIVVTMLISPFAPLSVLAVTLLVQSRHLFYGIAMLDRFRGMGWKKFYLIFGMCDETFSINYSADIPEGVDRGWFMFFVTLLNQLYWVSGATIGGLVGSFLKFNTKGLDFVMTAMFVTIFMNQWMKEKKKYTGLIGIGATAACLVLFGAKSFMVPAMVTILILLTIFRKLFSSKKPTPKYIVYLGKALPCAVFGMLVVYCLKNVSILSGTHGLPELLAIAVTAGLHLWKKNMLLSIAGGTIVYMLLVQC